MRLTNFMVPTLFALASFASAQAYDLRGEVRATDEGADYLHCAGWGVGFATPIPDNWVGRTLLMNAINIGTPTNPYLKVQKAALTDKSFFLGEMNVGCKAAGWVVAPVGSYVSVCLDVPTNVGWGSLSGVGIWMLGPDPCGFVDGYVHDSSDRTKGNGQFNFAYLVPPNDLLVGQTFVGQAMVSGSEGMFFTNADCQVVR